MKISNLGKIDTQKKDLIVFDLDGTLIKTKSPMDSDMSKLFSRLLAIRKVAVIGGGKYQVFQDLFLKRLKCPKLLLKKLFIFPTTSTLFYRFSNGWKKVYSIELSAREKADIRRAFKETFAEVGYRHPQKTYGQIIEDRKSQVTFSALGQEVVKVLGNRGVELKKQWLLRNKDLKMQMTRILQKKLPKLEVRAAGVTSIDVTKKGIDKAYGIGKIQQHLKIPVKRMLFVGDAIFEGGNDYAVVRTGVDYIKVSGPEETKKIIKLFLNR